MKKLNYFLLSSLFFFLSSASFAQQYYAFSSLAWNGNIAVHDFPHGNYDSNPNIASVAAFSLGKGHSYSLGLGYNINSSLGLELETSRLYGFKNRMYHIDQAGKETGTYYQGSGIRIMSQLVLNTGTIEEKNRFYAKMGFILGIKMQILELQYGIENLEKVRLKNQGLSNGMAASLGLKHRLKKNWIIFLECRLISQSYAPEKSEIIKWTINGSDHLPEVSVSSKLAYYHDSYMPTFPQDGNKPLNDVKRYYPFSSVGINFGLQYTFPAKAKQEKIEEIVVPKSKVKKGKKKKN